MVPMTTRCTPARTKACAHGSVFLPSCPLSEEHGSSVTIAVSGRTFFAAASSSAIASAWRPP
jgi:hypothetical protein